MLRDAEPTDALRIAQITVAGWQTAYVGIVPDEVIARQAIDPHIAYFNSREAFADGMRTIIVELNGVVTGYAHLGPARPEPDEQIDGCELWGMYVDPDHQGRGLGRTLMEGVLEHFRSVGCAVAYLWVMRDNVPARRFYESGGWMLDSRASRSSPVAQVRYQFTL